MKDGGIGRRCSGLAVQPDAHHLEIPVPVFAICLLFGWATSHLTSQLRRYQALAAALLTAVAASIPACWSQLPTTITAQTEPMPGLMGTAYSQ